jgi:RNA polymerase sigma-70 factor, ECF subfamily
LRYRTTQADQIVSHKAFLSTVVTRLCLNLLQSAQVQRESYIGSWLPEPVLTESSDLFVPAQQAELHDSLSIAFLTLLEDLTPLERAIFLLREVFDYEYAEIAGIVSREETACRQLFSRAKKHIAAHRPRFKPDQETHRQILHEFIQAAGTGDMEGLMQLLSEDVTLWADGGGKAHGAAFHPMHGRDKVAQYVLASQRMANDYHLEEAEVNDEPAMLIRIGGNLMAVLAISLDDSGRVSQIRAMANPDKLKWISGNEGESDEETP